MTDIKYNFGNRVALIVGGSRGIGRCVADKFYESGAKVYVASRNSDATNDYEHITCDISEVSEIRGMFNLLDKKEQAIDFVVNCAAANLCAGIEKIDETEWDRVCQTNLKSYFFICQEAVKRMRKNRFGSIVNISSIAGRHRSIVSGTHYTASKAGIIGLTRQLAYEVARDGIRVNVVCPSQTMTDMLNSSMSNLALEELSHKIPIGRISSTTEQADPILFLCSSGASYMTGAVVDVNGGQL